MPKILQMEVYWTTWATQWVQGGVLKAPVIQHFMGICLAKLASKTRFQSMNLKVGGGKQIL